MSSRQNYRGTIAHRRASGGLGSHLLPRVEQIVKQLDHLLDGTAVEVGVGVHQSSITVQVEALQVLCQFVAFIELGSVPADAMDPRTRIITAHAICGFANFGSIGILIGGLNIICPERRSTFLELAWRTLIAGTLATCLSGAVVGALPVALFTGGAG